MAAEGTLGLDERLRALEKDIQRDVVGSSEVATSAAHQSSLQRLLREAEAVWVEARRGGLVGPSDTFEDLSSTALAALCVPYHIADLRQRLVDGDRRTILAEAEGTFAEVLQLAVDLEVLREEEIEAMVERRDRDALVAHERRQRALKNDIDAIAQTLQREEYAALRRRRIAELDGAECEDDGGDGTLGEKRLERARALFRWCVGDSVTQMRLIRREKEMLEKITPERRELIRENYQRGMAAARENPKPSYTILPGGLMALRQEIGDNLMIDRHGPTMSLQEFAENEMALMKQQMEQQQQAAADQREEDERLGPDGCEERERQRQAKWDDWRDANPTIGITAKGNYS